VRWGDLFLIERIGKGSFGDVYRARDTHLGRDVALKLLRGPTRPDTQSSGLIHEGHLLGRIRHPNVVTVYGADCRGGQAGLWMELIAGETLEEELRRRG
jgi:serine/threonine protein kinase